MAFSSVQRVFDNFTYSYEDGARRICETGDVTVSVEEVGCANLFEGACATLTPPIYPFYLIFYHMCYAYNLSYLHILRQKTPYFSEGKTSVLQEVSLQDVQKELAEIAFAIIVLI